jgi:hypothetical protein
MRLKVAVIALACTAAVAVGLPSALEAYGPPVNPPGKLYPADDMVVGWVPDGTGTNAWQVCDYDQGFTSDWVRTSVVAVDKYTTAFVGTRATAKKRLHLKAHFEGTPGGTLPSVTVTVKDATATVRWTMTKYISTGNDQNHDTVMNNDWSDPEQYDFAGWTIEMSGSMNGGTGTLCVEEVGVGFTAS